MRGERWGWKHTLRVFPLTTHLSLLTAVAPLTAQRHDALHYEIELTLSATDSILRARVSTRWRLTGARPVILDLDSALTVTGATVDARPVRWRRRGNTIVLPVTGYLGREVTTSVTYSGMPREGLLVRGSGAGRTIFADNWPDRARDWLASNDRPGDKASVAWRITAPAEFGVVATGSLTGVDTLPEGMLRRRFVNPAPVPVYTMVFGMATFTSTALSPPPCDTGCVPVMVLTTPGDSAIAISGPFRNATRMIDFFAERFGAFPYAELRHVQSTTRFGGMENATAIFYDTRAIHEGSLAEATVAHETAHQWFGDAVTQSEWHHLWLSEGFASYGAALWAEHEGGDSALSATMRSARDAVIASPVVERPILDFAITDRMKLLNANNYQKGSWVLHSLRGLVGDEVFFRGIRRYVRSYQHGNALSGDFARIMGEEAGRDLTWYFHQALTQPGYPRLGVTTEVEGSHLVITVRQLQKKSWGLFRIPNLEVALDDRTITMDVQGALTRVATHWAGDAPPRQVLVDPKGKWLLEVRGER